jgi:hypothetical protein
MVHNGFLLPALCRQLEFCSLCHWIFVIAILSNPLTDGLKFTGQHRTLKRYSQQLTNCLKSKDGSRLSSAILIFSFKPFDRSILNLVGVFAPQASYSISCSILSKYAILMCIFRMTIDAKRLEVGGHHASLSF